MPILLTPASWFQIPRVGISPEVVAFWVTIKMEPHPITLDLTGRERLSVHVISLRKAAYGVRVHSIRTSATLSTQKREG